MPDDLTRDCWVVPVVRTEKVFNEGLNQKRFNGRIFLSFHGVLYDKFPSAK